MRLLLIEDEIKVADVIVRGLRAERFAVDVARDGITGWQMASSVEYDLIILDLMLPGLSGTEVLKRLQRAGSSAAVLVLTARDSIGDKVTQFEAGADDCVRERIDLTAKEYALLEYLAANAGRVLTRTMIMEHVWDESFEGLTNIVDVYVRHLRAKVDEAHEKKLIRTVRGAGYCLSDDADP